ncbi:GntR family transcriptional regulator [Streptosporangium subroseum]|uniref:GntR family transcriptional regulator n=1 Tax=Streptosporangium subroseum TaxID=106412 RepID=UPI003090A43B|nr:winged helix-turn-helix domain-containing protein [Streptosporangium subroseum]
MVELKGNRPKWKQIFEIIQGRIEDGTYPPGEKIPTVLELMGEFHVANPTAQKVFKALREEGLIHTEPGMGSFVVEDDATGG